ncbi:S53 family peptidase [Dictyobacter aurantiacus]|uniref:Kumamolisin n=1 Tax=Dictyobacter aurantiacus TaxID=1936993 RepID=A0A401ZIK1_9CHLR|nr:S53 family peptidase [Dictyobacter aurantiacus]GCE06670.1 kumamolisin [Dictyobacter aurantiacus]
MLCICLLTLTSCELGDTASSEATPTPTSNLQYQTLKLDIPQQALTAPVTGTLPANQVLHVGVTFKIDPNAIKKFDSNGSDSSSQQNSDDMAKKLGINEQAYQQFKQYFGIKDATINLNQTRTWMTIDIKAGELAMLMQTKFVIHSLNNRSFYTPDPHQMPKVPAQIAGAILAVSGLDNYSHPAHPGGFFQPAVTASARHRQNSMGVDCTPITNKSAWTAPILLPSDYVQTYGLAPFQQKGWYGQGQKVLLVEPYDTYNLDDVNAFLNCANFKGTLDTITLDGAPQVPTGFFDESTLDIDTVASVAPDAQIVDYQGDGAGAYQRGGDDFVVINDLLQRIIGDYRHNTHSGAVISMSFGGDESAITNNDLMMINQSLQILTEVEHMTVFVATGDCAAFSSGIYGQLGVSFPASDPWVVATGGTMLQTDMSGQRASETAWSDSTADHSTCNNSWGSGGGVSTAFKAPIWQQQSRASIAGLQNRYSTGYRQLPDLAAAATKNVCYMQYQWGICDGTSAATPLVASGMAVLNGAFKHNMKHFFFGPSGWYAAQARESRYHPFYNITQGNNIYYQATPGWNYPTGLGTPNFLGLYQSLQQLLRHK